jgi:hypothetical protein
MKTVLIYIASALSIFALANCSDMAGSTPAAAGASSGSSAGSAIGGTR